MADYINRDYNKRLSLFSMTSQQHKPQEEWKIERKKWEETAFKTFHPELIFPLDNKLRTRTHVHNVPLVKTDKKAFIDDRTDILIKRSEISIL